GLAASGLALPRLGLLAPVAPPSATAAPLPPSAAMAAADWATRAHMLLDTLPPPLVATLLALAPAAALIGWLTTQATVRAWLRTLP
ncbi:MAG: ABC transporter permease, partial [Gluconacetobacter sp.]